MAAALNVAGSVPNEPADIAVTVFSSLKPFAGHIGIIQRNALANWRALGLPVILFGDDPGVREAAAAYGCRHVPTVATTSYGTPRLDDIFRQAQEVAQTPYLAFLNGDILLPPSFAGAVARCGRSRKPFLMVGRRWDADVTTELDFSPGWPERLDAIRGTASLHGPWGIDMFAFPRDQVSGFPPLAIGRMRWDNFFIHHSARNGVRLINATDFVPLLHQNHDYRHVPGRTGPLWQGPESTQNNAIIDTLYPGVDWRNSSIWRARWRLTSKGRIVPDVTPARISFHLKLRRDLLAERIVPRAAGAVRSAVSPDLYRAARNAWRRLAAR